MVGATFTAVALQGETLDALCWRVLGQTAGIVEQALDLNRGIAGGADGVSAALAEGQAVILPAITAPSPTDRDIIQLWD